MAKDKDRGQEREQPFITLVTKVNGSLGRWKALDSSYACNMPAMRLPQLETGGYKALL